MSKQRDSLYHLEGFGSLSIERNKYEKKTKHKCILPVREVEIGLRNVDNSFNEGGHDEQTTRYAGKPAQSRRPPYLTPISDCITEEY
jgi:hypothetical protein